MAVFSLVSRCSVRSPYSAPGMRPRLCWVESVQQTAFVYPSLTQAERELHLVDKVEEWQAWDPLVAEPPPTQWKWP